MSKEVKKNNKESESDDCDKNFSELLKEREKKEDIDESLKEIFEAEEPAVVIASKNKDGYNDNMKTIERREIDTWRKITRLFFALLTVLAGISWTSFLIFNQGSRLDTKDIEFKISGPETAAVGQELIYEIQYKNLSQYNLKNAEISLNYPDGFIFFDAVPEPEAGKHLWKIEQIDAKRSGRVEFKGKLAAPVDAKAIFSAAITYRPENFSSTFSADSGLTTTVNSLGLNIAAEAPYFFNLNEEGEILIKYAKQKENFIDSFSVLFAAGENFAVSVPKTSGPWAINEVSDKQEKFSVKGKFLKKPAEGEKLKLSLAIPEEIKSGEGAEQKTQTKNHVFYEYEWSPAVAEGALNLSLTVNGANAGKPANFGDALNFVVHYKNGSEAALKNIIIMASIDSAAVDWKTLQDEQKGEVKDGSIIWTKEQIKNLGEIKAGAEDSFGFSLKIKTREQLQDIASNALSVQTALDYSIDSALKGLENPLIKITTKINSDLNFVNEVRYFDRSNIAVGEGPLPPKVGQKTSFHVYWTLTNSRHDLENIEVSASLPSYVAWEDNINAAGDGVSYSAGERLISWKISSLDAVAQPATLDFVISVTPQASDKNKILTLVNQPQVTARDKETGGAINLTGKAKTTILEDDAVGKGQGKVE
ncbi:hypothetical protein COU00_01620 [Candidatus Falkowbacteria bacterium CG10_big_fil_rev_8_21_14_0_10_43_11]|uniref:DUF11 domain-containing protein n=1 Tax=Candidatus Falkowbacteria bacterium CG10_big_fil_rev_8_21_14_0_10_43_11 TaxID=1974568 RepID=A0A2M6WMC5_9BACT|nr:MAG: hypothetical protein COU00_01620 [Candidatus Falkowbacteria bacterium CG10_big_fil_rev_8_21_14_0_10_43_11]